MSSHREELVKELKIRLPFVGNSDIDQICKFIEADRARIVEPLVRCKDYMQNQNNLWPTYESAIDETLKLAGVE